MYEEIKSIDFCGEMKTNDLYYLFKTNSSQINLEILSKLQKYTTLTEFFKHYMRKDLKTLNDAYDIFINKISTFSSENHKIKFDSNIDQYISDFSYIYILFNSLIKLKESLTSILLNIKNKLSNLYNEYHIDKSKQEKIDECVSCLLDIFQNKNHSQKLFSKSSTKDNSLDNNLNNIYHYDNRESYDSCNQQMLIEDLLGNTRNSMKLNKISNTPRFNTINNKNNSNPDPTHIKENNSLKEQNSEEQNKQSDIKLNQSVDSEFTLSSNKKKKINDDKAKENISNDNNNELSNNIKDYITNIDPNDFIIKHPHKRRTTSYIKKRNSKMNLNVYKSLDGNNMQTLFSAYKCNNKNILNTKENNDSYKKFYLSSSHLFMKEESKMYTELLEIIIELYRENKITIEQKLKLKKLIICKSPKILNVYKSFNQDDDFIIKLKEIVQ